MKVVSILLALINFLAGVLLILSCISSNETFAWSHGKPLWDSWAWRSAS